MFTHKLKNIIVASAIALGAMSAVAATTTSASAGSRGGIYLEGPGISFGFGDIGHRGRHYDRGPRYDRGHYGRRRSCRPRKAVRKARRRGLRDAHVVRVGHRGVVVAGYKWGERVVVGFGRHRSCPVRFVRAR